MHLSRWLLPAPLLLIACDFFGGPGQGGGKRLPASVTCLSTHLALPTQGAASVVAAGAHTSRKVGAATVDTVTQGEAYLSYRVTPINMEGRLIQLSLMVGEPGAGGASALHLVTLGKNGFLGSAIDDPESLPRFNLAERLTVGDGFECCWSTYPSDDKAKSGWFEILFAHLDVTFELTHGALAGMHTLRTVFADGAGYRRGDLLYRKDNAFLWVDSSTGAFAATRPAHPLRLGWVADFAGSGDGRGNQHIPSLFIAVQDSQKVNMPADTVLANAWEFVADFIFDNGLIFRRVDPATMTSVAQMLGAFDIRADRDNTHSGADGLSCNFYAIKTPLGEPRPNAFKDSLDQWITSPRADSLR